MEKPWKVIVAFVGVFVAGAVFGGFFTLRSARERLRQEQEVVRAAVPAPVTVPVAVAPQPAPVAVEPPKPEPVVAVAPKPAPATPNPAPNRPALSAVLMRQFAQRLNLTNAQREKLRPILGRSGEDFQHLAQENDRARQQYLADTVRVSDRMFNDVSALLTAEQRVELEKMRREREERLERDRQKQLELQAKNKAPKATPDPLRTLIPPNKGKPGGGS